jgi:hypothetical protein
VKKDALQYFADTDLTLLALVLFLASFAFLIFRVYFFDSKEKYDRLSEIPLRNEGGRDELQ